MSSNDHDDPLATRSASPSSAEPAGATAPHLASRSPQRPSAAAQLRDPDRYQIINEHGRGGLGRVSRAHDRDLGRDVAIKELISRGSLSEVRFLREALITARLEHPGIVPVHEAGRWPDGTPFYAMKLVAGRPLRDLIAERTTVTERIGLLHHVIAVADAIAYAHGRNIIHRDLKPANVIVGDFGETIVIDWGLAKDLSTTEDAAIDGGPFRAHPDANLTSTGSVLGTPAYMAPEQERGEHVDQRADVFAIGAMLWELCAIAKVPPENLQLRHKMLARAGIDKDLIAIIDKSLAHDACHRYIDAGALAADLRSFKSGARISARSYSPLAMVTRWTRKHRALAISTMLSGLLVVAGILIYLHNVTIERDKAHLALDQARTAAVALGEANNATKLAYDNLTLKNAELLLDSDATAAATVLASYTGFNTQLHDLLQAKAEGLGVARRQISGHKDTIRRITPLEDGTLLTSSEDGSIAQSDVTGAFIVLARDGTARGTSALSQETKLLAYACQPAGLCAIDLVHHTVYRLKTPAYGIPDAIDFSPDGQLLVARYGQEVVIWTMNESEPALQKRWPVKDARSISFTSDHQVFISTNRKLLLLDINNGLLAGSIDFESTSMAVGRREIVLGNKTGIAIAIKTEQWPQIASIQTVCKGQINATTIMPHADSFAYGCQSGEFGVRSIVSTAAKEISLTQASPILSLSVSVDERYVVVGGKGGAMHIYDLTSGTLTVYKGQFSRLAMVSAPTKHFPYFVSGDDNGYVRIWDRPQATRLAMHADGPFYDVAILQNDTIIGVGAEPLLRWTRGTRSGQEAAHPGGGIAIRRSPDMEHFATFGYDGTLILWSSEPRIQALQRFNTGLLTDAEFNTDGSALITSGEDGRLAKWHLGSAVPEDLARFDHSLSNVEIIKNSDTAIISERDGSIWSVSTTTPRKTVRVRIGAGEVISRSTISLDNKWLAIGTSLGEVSLYSTFDWRAMTALKAKGAIRSITFAATMNAISVVSEDGFVYLRPVNHWSTAQEMAHWKEIAMPVRSARFSPAGDILAITTSDGGVFFYSIKDQKWTYFPILGADVFGGRFNSDGALYVTYDSAANIISFNMTDLFQKRTKAN